MPVSDQSSAFIWILAFVPALAAVAWHSRAWFGDPRRALAAGVIGAVIALLLAAAAVSALIAGRMLPGAWSVPLVLVVVATLLAIRARGSMRATPAMVSAHHRWSRCAAWTMQAVGWLGLGLGLLGADYIASGEGPAATAPVATSACLLLCGLAINAMLDGARRQVQLLLGSMAVVVLAALLQTAPAIARPLFTMTQPTALVFIGGALGIWLSAGRERAERWRHWVWIGGVLLCAAAISALLGIAFEPAYAYPWGTRDLWTVLLALGLLAFGVALYSAPLGADAARTGHERLLPGLALIGAAVFSIYLGTSLAERQQMRLQRSTTEASAAVKGLLNVYLRARFNGVSRLAWRLMHVESARRSEWFDFEATQILRDFPGGTWMAIIAPDGSVRYQQTKSGLDPGLGPWFARQAAVDALITAIGNDPTTRMSAPLHLPTGDLGFAVAIALNESVEDEGFLLLGIRYTPFLAFTMDTVQPGYALQLSDAGLALWSRGEIARDPDSTSVHAALDAFGRHWRIRVSPDTATRELALSRLPEVVLASGLAVSILLGLAVYEAASARSRARRLQRSSLRARDNAAALAHAQQIASVGSWQMELRHVEKLETNPMTWSDQNYRIFGYEPGVVEVTTGLYLSHVHPDDLAAARAALRRSMVERCACRLDHRIVLRDGSVRHVHVDHDLHDADGESPRLLGTVQDVTARNRQEAMQRQQKAILESVARGEAQNLTLDRLVRLYEEHNPESLCSVLLLDAAGLHLRHGSAPSLPATYTSAIDGTAIGPSVGSCGTAAFLRRAVVVPDIQLSEYWANYRELAASAGLRACWSAPIMGGDARVLGTFAVYYREVRSPSSEELGVMADLSAIASIAIEHAQTQRQLADSEQRFRSLFDYNPNAVYAMDLEGRMLALNDSMLSAGPQTHEYLLGRKFDDLIVPEHRAETRRYFELAAAGVPQSYDTAAIRMDGSRVEMRVSNLPIVVAGERVGVFGVAQDITPLRKAQAMLAEQLAFTEAISNSVVEGIYAIDRDGRINYFNPAAQQLLGWTPEEVIGALAVERFAPDMIPPGMLALRKGGAVTLDEVRYVRPDGTPVDVACSAAPLRRNDAIVGAVVVVRDIAERKRAQQVQLERDQFFELSQEFLVIALNGRFLQVNPAFTRGMGHSQEALTGQPMSAFIHPDDLNMVETGVTEVHREGKVDSFLHRARNSAGEYRWLEWAIARGPQGTTFGVGRDVTQRRQSEQAMRQLMQDLQARNQELQDFAFVASHDLQEPLRKILTFGDRLLGHQALAADAQTRDYLGRMRSAAGRMQILIDDLLAYSRVTTRAHDFDEVDLAAIAADAVSDLETAAEAAHATISLEPLPRLRGDAVQLRQVLQNLIGNAIKFHAPGRVPRIRVWAEEFTSPADAGGERRLRINVQDNGIGFDNQFRERIFAPFQRLHGRSEYPGSGIGLAIVRKIVERHGGTISASGIPDEGATFTVELPMGRSERIATGPPNAQANALR